MNIPRANKRNSETVNGEVWHFAKSRWWSPDTMGGSMTWTYTLTRYSDGHQIETGTQDRDFAIERIKGLTK